MALGHGLQSSQGEIKEPTPASRRTVTTLKPPWGCGEGCCWLAFCCCSVLTRRHAQGLGVNRVLLDFIVFSGFLSGATRAHLT